LGNTPTIGNLINHSQQVQTPISKNCANVPLTIAVTQANQQARAAVQQEYVLVQKASKYGHIERIRLDDVVQVMYKNFSSLELFMEGPARHKKVRRLNKLMADYGVDVLAGCETQTD
jgi:hypothetical protein